MLGDMCGDDAFAACALVACDARGGVGGADAARAAVRDVVEFVREHRGELAAATAALRPTWRADGDDDDAADGGGEGAAARCVVLPREEAELLCDYLSACTSAAAGGDDDDASAAAALRRQLIAALVPACLRLLATPCGGDVEDAATGTATTTTPATHERARRLLLAAFDADFVGVTAAVAAALSPVLLQPLLRNAARYVGVGECVIALLGSALPATTLARPTTHPTPRFLSAAWLSARLPRQLVAHARVAAGDARGGALFFLARELVLRGGSCGAGPVADELLTRDAVALLADDAAASCERALAGDDADAAAPLCHAAVGVLAQMVRLSRRTLLPPWHLYEDDDDVGEEDDAPPAATAAGVCAPVCVLLSRLPRFAALLRDDGGDDACRCCRGGALAACVRRAARAAVCELLVELALLRRADVDAALCACDAVALLVRQCRLHPHSDRLARALRGLVGELAARQPRSRGDALIACALRRSDGAAVESPPLLLASLVDFAASRCTALSAFSVDAVDELLAPLRGDGDDEASRPLAAALRGVLRARGDVAADVAARVRDGRDVVTGARFRARGSVVAAPPVTHRAVVNCAGDRYTLRRDSGSGSGSAMDALPDDSVGEARRDTDKENARVSRAGGEKRGGGGGEGGVLARLAGEAAAAREHGSPQLRAYPEFRLMHITFGGGGGGGGGA